MAWKVSVERIAHVKPHPNADKLELAYIGEWQLVVRKDQFKKGDLVVYFPQDTLIPPNILEQIGLTGKLSGSGKNRVKAIRLRGEYSIGVVMPAAAGEVEGEDVTLKYGCDKYEPPVPVELAGKIRPLPITFQKYDVDHIRDPRTRRQWHEGEEVLVMEKIHGTNAAFGVVDGEFIVCSRNLALQESDTNTYWRVARKYDIEAKLRSISHLTPSKAIWLHGEIYGPTATLKYGSPSEPSFAAFDMRYEMDEWWEWIDLNEFCLENNIPVVPHIWTGPFNYDKLKELCVGNETVSGKSLHIREGVVVRKFHGHCLAKLINPAYMEMD